MNAVHGEAGAENGEPTIPKITGDKLPPMVYYLFILGNSGLRLPEE
jgi:hypothetical protein